MASSEVLAQSMNHPDHDRTRLLQLVRFFNQPMVKADLRALRKEAEYGRLKCRDTCFGQYDVDCTTMPR